MSTITEERTSEVSERLFEVAPAENEWGVTPDEIMNRAADLIEEFGWCQFHPAITESGERCDPHDSRAVSFCLTGAVERAVYDLCGGWLWRYQGLPKGIWAKGMYGSPTPLNPKWNNDPDRTREQVIGRLRDLAAESA